MLKIRNVTKRTITQLLEGKIYILEPGTELDLPDTVAAWIAGKLNDFNRNDQREPGDRAPWVEILPAEVTSTDASKGIFRGQPPKKAPEPKQAEPEPLPVEEATPAKSKR